MIHYLVRHADAIDLADDAARPLSKKGEEQVKTLAAFLGRSDAFAPEEIWHSPLLRAQQTAELLARRLELKAALSVKSGLQPEDDPRPFASRLAGARRSVAVVGHEPYLSALTSLLVTGRAEPAAFVVKKCAVIALENVGAHWAVRWQVSPEIVR